MASVNNFYSKKTSQHRFLRDAICEVDDDNPQCADIVIIRPPTGGFNSDQENEDEVADTEKDLPGEVAGEVEVLQYSADDNNSETHAISHEEEYKQAGSKRRKVMGRKGREEINGPNHRFLQNKHHHQNKTKFLEVSLWIILL